MNERRIVHTDAAPAAVGPYSQAVIAGGMVFTSGQIALNPATGELVSGSIEDEARQALENLRAVVEAAGSSMDRVVKVVCFLTDMADFARVNAVYSGYMPGEAPARSCVAVAALPKGARIELEAVALLDG